MFEVNIDQIEGAITGIAGIVSELMMFEIHVSDIAYEPNHVTIPTMTLISETIGSIRMHLERIEFDLTDSIKGVDNKGGDKHGE